MTTIATVGVWISAVVLVLAGGEKIVRPATTVDALRDAGLPGGRTAARTLGAAEVLTSGLVLTLGGMIPAAALLFLYAGFATHNARQLGRGRSRCGCFGDRSAPLSLVHLVTSLLGVVAGAAAIIRPVGGMPEVLAPAGLAAATPTVVLLLLAGILVRTALTDAENLRALVDTGRPRTESA